MEVDEASAVVSHVGSSHFRKLGLICTAYFTSIGFHNYFVELSGLHGPSEKWAWPKNRPFGHKPPIPATAILPLTFTSSKRISYDNFVLPGRPAFLSSQQPQLC